MKEEQRHIHKRIWKSRIQSILFYLCRGFPIHRKKIVFCCIEGTTGYTCNPKYIAEELIRREEGFQLVWLVNDMGKKFPKEVKAVHNTLLNRAYHLSTAHFWIDNSRKQLEVRKRRGQIYIQTWHAKLGFKPTCLDRGASFSRIAYLVSKHDSDMIDYVLSNSRWYDETLSTGMLYNGKTLRTGSPRCDILVKNRMDRKKAVRKKYGIPEDAKILMYAPTFRGGSQEVNRTIEAGCFSLDYDCLIHALENRFGGCWYIFLRLHPQLVARNLDRNIREIVSVEGRIVDISRVDDMYELLAGCNAFMTDYSSAAFDAAVMRVPVFLYAEDSREYQKERGRLLWKLEELPFPFAVSNDELERSIINFDEKAYLRGLEQLFADVEMVEDGLAAKRVADVLEGFSDSV